MKFVVGSSIFLVIAGSIAIFLLADESPAPELPIAPIVSQQPPEFNPASTSTTTSATLPKHVPAGFRGPTGQPRIIGPSGPPPNY